MKKCTLPSGLKSDILKEGQVHVWLLYTNLLWDWETEKDYVGEEKRPSKICSKEELKRAKEYVNEQDRTNFLHRRTWIRLILSHYLDMKPKDIQWSIGEYGKHSVKDCDLSINWSNSDHVVMLAIGPPGTKIGVDLEKIRDHPDYLMLVDKHCTEKEKEYLKQLKDDWGEFICRPTFFHMWTGKEAYLKALGTGIGFGPALHEIDFPFESHQASEWAKIKFNVYGKNEWSLPWYKTPKILGHQSSLVVLESNENRVREIQYFELH